MEFLRTICDEHQLPSSLLKSIKTSNDFHKLWSLHKIHQLFPSVKGITITIWGLTYKSNTDTLRRSLLVEICNQLLEEGANIRIHDPVVKELPSHWQGRVARFDDPLISLHNSDLLLIGTGWEKYKDMIENFGDAPTQLTILDPTRFLASKKLGKNIRYISIGTAHKL